jgi:hypothetical protein
MKILIPLLLIIHLLSGRLTQENEKFSGNDAIAKVIHEKRNEFPDKAGKVKGTIYGGGPAPGIKVPGEFESSVNKKGKNVYIVTLTEYWNAKDFHTNSNSNHEILSHFWKFEVSSTEVKFVADGGDFSPEFIE